MHPSGANATTGADHAVVIGASLAGLTIAQALRPRFAAVTVLDRDRLPDQAVPRPGVPQDRHVHLLLASGAIWFEQLFPGLLEELIADGAAVGDPSRIRLCLNGHRLARGPAGDTAVFASRPFIEHHVRRRIRADPGITVEDGCTVRGLTTSDDGRRIVGVRTTSTSVGGVTGGSAGGDGGTSADEQHLPADLVVDASGRRSSSPAWLETLGYAPPPIDELPVDLRYLTRQYRIPDEVLGGDRNLLIGPTPDLPLGGALSKIEGDRWITTLFAMGGRRPPRDPDRFEAFAAELAASDIHDALVAGEPLDEPARYRFPANQRRRYDRCRLPHGFLAAGDAVCSFNPIYGQGMSVAAHQAVALRSLLADGMAPTPEAWFAAIQPMLDLAWELTCSGDLAVHAIEGRRDLMTRVRNGYLARLHAAASRDPALTDRFLRVAGLVDPPSTLLRPSALGRVLTHRLRSVPA